MAWRVDFPPIITSLYLLIFRRWKVVLLPLHALLFLGFARSPLEAAPIIETIEALRLIPASFDATAEEDENVVFQIIIEKHNGNVSQHFKRVSQESVYVDNGLNAFSKVAISPLTRYRLGSQAARYDSVSDYRDQKQITFFRCDGPGFEEPSCAAGDQHVGLNDAHSSNGGCDKFGKTIRNKGYGNLVWDHHGWFALTRADWEQTLPDEPPDLLTAGIGKFSASNLGAVLRCENLDELLYTPAFFEKKGGSRATVSNKSVLFRDMTLRSDYPDRARIVFQSGIDKKNTPAGQDDVFTIDDNLFVADVCANSSDPLMVRPCNGYDDRQPSDDLIKLPEKGGWEGQPAFSPDGRWIAYLRYDPFGERGEADEAGQRNLWLVRNTVQLADLGEDRNAINLTAELDYPILEFEWSCQGKCILIKISKAGRTPILQINYERPVRKANTFLDLHAWQTLRNEDTTEPGRIVLSPGGMQYIKEFEVTNTGKTLYAIVSSLDSRQERVVRIRRTSPHAATRFDWDSCESISHNDGQAKLTCRDEPGIGITVRRLTDALEAELAPNGRSSVADEISKARFRDAPKGFVFYPPCYETPRPDDCTSNDRTSTYPLILFLHGGPHESVYNSFDFLRQKFLLGHGKPGRVGTNGFIIVAPDPTGSIGYGKDYRKATMGAWGGQVVTDIEDLLVILKERAVPMRIDESQVYIVGESFGAYLINMLQVRGNQTGLSGSPSKYTALSPRGALALYGAFDLEAYPCHTDQKWFPFFEFGYFEDCDRRQVLYMQEFDPARYFRCYRGKLTGADCDGIRHRSARGFPTLIVHGNKDTRVNIQQSQALARELNLYGMKDEQKNYGIPFRVCEVADGWHGFNSVDLNNIVAASFEWFECASTGFKNDDEDRCPLQIGDISDKKVDCSVSKKHAWLAAGAGPFSTGE